MRANHNRGRGRLPQQVADAGGAAGGDTATSACSGGAGESCSCRSSRSIGKTRIGTKYHDSRSGDRNLTSHGTVHLLEVVDDSRACRCCIDPPRPSLSIGSIVVDVLEIERASDSGIANAQERPFPYFAQPIDKAEVTRAKRIRAATVGPRQTIDLIT